MVSGVSTAGIERGLSISNPNVPKRILYQELTLVAGQVGPEGRIVLAEYVKRIHRKPAVNKKAPEEQG